MNIQEVMRWLGQADDELTLVGGQSVALWEHLLGLPVRTETIDYVLHPFDCLASHLANVALLPAKRSPRGFDQLRAAIQMCHAYLTHLGEQGRSQEAIKMANRIFDLTITDPGKRVFFDHGIDLLNALTEPEIFQTPDFTLENYPRQVERVRSKRERFARFLRSQRDQHASD